MIEIYKDGDHMAIQTDAKDDRQFINEMSELLSDMILDGHFMFFTQHVGKLNEILEAADSDTIKKLEDGDIFQMKDNIKEVFANDWEFQFKHLLQQIVDICCKYRGYKNGVHEKRILISGDPNVNGLSPIAAKKANKTLKQTEQAWCPESE